jgi:nicotinamidase-related amidase
MQHPSGIPERIVRKVVARRGRLHAFESLEAARTALVVIDLDTATVGRNDESGASAFFPGKCDLPQVLEPLGIDTLLIAGAVTNICCESSARDAVELGYKVVMASDALHGQSHGLHEATLATFYRIFGDVRPSSEIMELLAHSARSPRCFEEP